jgi:hypothetical protein
LELHLQRESNQNIEVLFEGKHSQVSNIYSNHAFIKKEQTKYTNLKKNNRLIICNFQLLAESHASNKAAAQLQCTDAHIASLFRLILYLLSRPIDNVRFVIKS